MNKFLKILLVSSVAFSLFSGPNEDLLIAAKAGNFAVVEAAIRAGVILIMLPEVDLLL